MFLPWAAYIERHRLRTQKSNVRCILPHSTQAREMQTIHIACRYTMMYHYCGYDVCIKTTSPRSAVHHNPKPVDFDILAHFRCLSHMHREMLRSLPITCVCTRQKWMIFHSVEVTGDNYNKWVSCIAMKNSSCTIYLYICPVCSLAIACAFMGDHSCFAYMYIRCD